MRLEEFFLTDEVSAARGGFLVPQDLNQESHTLLVCTILTNQSVQIDKMTYN
jgi:hypothetical protein